MIKKILLALILLAVIGGAIGYYQYNRPVASIENKKPEVEITADDLVSAFTDDENAANQQYNEKIVQVKGTVSNMTKEDNLNKIYLETDNPMSGVICEMEEGQELGTLKTGDEVKIKGRCTGFLSDVILVQSSLVK